MTYERPQKDKSKKVDAKAAENNKGRTYAPSDVRKEIKSIGTRSEIGSYALEEENVKVVAAVKEAPKVRTVKAKKKTPFPTSVVFVTIICTVLFMFMMLTMAQINEFTRDISTLQDELSDLRKKEEGLKKDVEMKYDLSKIEKIAVDEYGMVKGDTLTTRYINIGGEDKIESFEPEKKKEGLFGSVMSAMSENFKSAWEYFK